MRHFTALTVEKITFSSYAILVNFCISGLFFEGLLPNQHTVPEYFILADLF